MITAAQCRAARGLIDWTQTGLAEKAGLAVSTVKDFEAGRRTPHESNLKKIIQLFEAAGIEFTNGDAPGVRLHQRGKK
jgi:transcriptional regulator with XRE-family HTH domain